MSFAPSGAGGAEGDDVSMYDNLNNIVADPDADEDGDEDENGSKDEKMAQGVMGKLLAGAQNLLSGGKKPAEGKDAKDAKAPSESVAAPNVRQFDFRKGKIPPSARVINGRTNIVQEADGSTSLLVDPGSHVYLNLEALPPNDSKDMVNSYTVTMDIKLEKLPKKGVFIASMNDRVDRTTQSPGEVQVYPDGGVGFFGIQGLAKMKPNRWTRVVITCGGGFGNSTRVLTTYVNGKRCAQIRKPVLQAKDGRFAMDSTHVRLFQNAKGTFEKISVRYVEIRSECWSAEKIRENNFTNRIYSAAFEEEKERKRKMFAEMSLQQLYRKPPPIWMHPAFGAEFGDAYLQGTGLEGGTLSVCIHVFALVVERTLAEQKSLLEGLDEDIMQSLDSIKNVLKKAVTLSKQHAFAMKGGNQLVSFVRKFRVRYLDALDDGETILIPGGCAGRPFVYILSKVDDFAEFSESYSFAIVNTDPHWGLGYHTHSAQVQPKLKFKQVIVFNDIPPEKIEQNSFWMLLFMLNSMRVGPDKVYDWLLPYLQDRPLEQAVADTEDNENVDFRSPQRSQMAYYRVLLESFNFMMRRSGLSVEQAKRVSFAVRGQYLAMAYNDLRIFSKARMGLSGSDFRLVEIAVQQVAYSAVKLARRELLVAKQLAEVKKRLADANELAMNLPSTEQQSIDPPPKMHLNDRGLSARSQWNYQPLYDRLLRKENVDGLAGAPIQIPAYVPIDYLQIQRTVETFEEALTALRWCDKMCTLTAVQGHFVKNISFLKVALIQHTMVHVLPVPKSPDSETYEDCVWNQPVVYGRQLDVLILCQRLIEHFTASVLSLKNNRPLDAVRIIIPACIAAIADAMMRKEATDDPSELCQHLMGARGGTPYRLSTGMLGSQTETIEVHTPELNVARTAVLDYFSYQEERKYTPMMRWEESHTNMWGAECQWLAGLASDWAFPSPGHPEYLCGGLIIKNWPELACYRDVAFYFKYFLNTDSAAFPPSGRDYVQAQAQLRWVYTPKGYAVITQLVPPKFPMFCKPRPGIPFGHRFETFADPSKLTGHTVNTEDDVLHIKNLPGFPVSEMRRVKDEKGNWAEKKVPRVVIGQKDSELLMSYLTVPYMRVPLVISFFATEDRIHALRSSQLRGLLDSVMFEPGAYLPMAMNQEPRFVPTRDERLLATPYGLLINELHRSPDAVLKSTLRLLELALDLDTGSFKASTVDIILYVVRLCARVDSYIDFMVELKQGTHECIRTPLRDTQVTMNTLSKLIAYRTELRKTLRGKVHKMVEGWIVQAMREIEGKGDDEVVDRNTKVACRLHAHLLLLYRNVTLDTLTPDIASTLLCGYIFLTIRHTWNLNLLEVPEFELYELLQVMRRRLIAFTRSLDQQPLNSLMEAAVRVSTGTGLREAPGGDSKEAKARNWAYIRGPRSGGRFTVLTAQSRFYQIAESKVREVDDTRDLGVEIDWQIVQLTLRTSHLKALSKAIAANPDVTMIFGTKSMQAATIQNAENREWVRLVGRQHDIQYWKTPEPRMCEQELMREYDPTELEESERWILPIWEPVRRKFFVPPPPNPPIPIWLPERPLDPKAEVCYMVATHPKKGGTIKEIFVWKTLQIVQVYDVMSYGRRFYRSLVYSTDARYAIRDLQPTTANRKGMWVSWGRHEAGNPWGGDRSGGVGCVITRHRDDKGNLSGTEEQLIPERLLYGIVPHCLFTTHRFWQDKDDNIHGYPLTDPQGPIICVHLKGLPNVGSFEEKGVCARITRVPMKLFKARQREAERLDLLEAKLVVGKALSQGDSLEYGVDDDDAKERPDEDKSVDEVELTLVNMLYAPPKSKIFNLFNTLKRIEKLSFMMCWSRSTNLEGGEFEIDLVELPRLKLTFTARKDDRGKPQLYSVDHSDLYLSNERYMSSEGSNLIGTQIRGIPHSLLMQNANGEMKILVPCIEPVRPRIQSAPFSSELVLNYANAGWFASLSQRYFLYPMHISLSFLFTPTLSSALYLLLLRFLNRDYSSAFRLVHSVGTDAVFSDEEAMIFMNLAQCNHDKHPDAHAVRLAISHVMIDSEGALTSPNQQFMDAFRLARGQTFKCDVTGKQFKQEGTIFFKCLAPNGPKGFTACERVMKGKVPLPWDLTNECTGFVTKLNHVSSTCRITHENQLELLDKAIISVEDDRYNPRKGHTQYGIILNRNRYFYLEALLAGRDQARCFHLPRVPESKWPLLVNTTALNRADMANEGITSLSVLFNAPPAVGGFMAFQVAQKFLTPVGNPPRSEDSRGQIYKLGFLFLYGLYTGTIKCKIGTEDDSQCFALLLTQLLHDRRTPWNPLVSILDVIGKNPHIIPGLPKFRDTRRHKHPRISVIPQGDEKTSPFAQLLEKLLSKLPALNRQDRLELPDPDDFDRRAEDPTTCPVVQPTGRRYIIPKLSNLQQNRATLDPIDGKKLGVQDLDMQGKDMVCFTDQPMKKFVECMFDDEGDVKFPKVNPDDAEDAKDGNFRPILSKYRFADTKRERACDRLPFDVSAHPQAQSEVARMMLKRFADDAKIYADKMNGSTIPMIDSLLTRDIDMMLQDPQGDAVENAIMQMENLIEEFSADRDEDKDFVDKGLNFVDRVANHVEIPPDQKGSKMVQFRVFQPLF